MMPAIARMTREDMSRVMAGVREAAERLRAGLADEPGPLRERGIRSALKRLQEPPRGVDALMTAPISFLAAVAPDGVVIARDAEPDRMRGFDLGGAAPVVKSALVPGVYGAALTELPGSGGDAAAAGDAPPSVTVLFAAPAFARGAVVGAIVAGLPLPRISRRMSRQLQLESARNVGQIDWVLLVRGARSFPYPSFPPELVGMVPSESDRAKHLAESPGGYTGHFRQFGRAYGYGVMPLPRIGEGVVAVVFRSNPT